MAQSGYMLLGIFSFNPNIISGVFLQMLAHSLAIAALFMIVGVIEKIGENLYKKICNG